MMAIRFIRYNLLPLLLLCLSAILLSIATGCDEGGGPLGSGLIEEPPVSFTITDTLTVETSTVLMDSVVTQATDTILFGSYQDDYLGSVTADGYLKFSLGSGTFSPSRDARYDSLTLIMTPHYFYGDTTQTQNIRVHRVLEEIEPDEDEDLEVLYNFNFFDHEPHPLGTLTFRAERGRELEVPLAGTFGRALLKAAQDEDDIVTNNEDFQDYFKGVVIKADDAINTTITGVAPESSETDPFGEPIGGDSGILLRLYYSDLDAGGTRSETHYDFPVVSHGSFSHIRSQKPAPLNSLVQADDQISSRATDHQTFVQSGIGLMTRIDLDEATVDNLHNLVETHPLLLSAHLVVIPVAGTYGTHTPLPQTLSLLIADDQNRIIGELAQTQASIDEEFHRTTYYLFDIIDFVDHVMQTESFTGDGLLLTTPPSIYDRSVDRVVMGDGDNRNYRMFVNITVAEIN